MKLLYCLLLVSCCTGCSNLITQAPSVLPSLERCRTVDYHRDGQMATLTLKDCVVPVGELAK